MLEWPLDTTTRGRAGLQFCTNSPPAGNSVPASAMEKIKKPLESFVNNNTDSKNRSLTSIIDQLLINRSKTNDQPDNSPSSTTGDCGMQSTELVSESGNNSNHSSSTSSVSSHTSSAAEKNINSGISDSPSEVDPRHSPLQGVEEEEEAAAEEVGEESASAGGNPNNFPKKRTTPEKISSPLSRTEEDRLSLKEEENAADPTKTRFNETTSEKGGQDAFRGDNAELDGEARPSPAASGTGRRRAKGGKRGVKRQREALRTPAEDHHHLKEEEKDHPVSSIERSSVSPAIRDATNGGAPSTDIPPYSDKVFAVTTEPSSKGLSSHKSIRSSGSGTETSGPSNSRTRTPNSGKSGRENSMPTDTLSVQASALREPVVKSERFSPEIDSSSPSLSPHSPSPARSFPLGAFGLGLRTAPSDATSTAGLAATVPAFPHQSPAGLERFSPATTTPHSGLTLPGPPTTPAIKQMEMMTRNYSDFMRSLAAKYNNQNSQDNNNALSISPTTNGLSRLDSGYPFKTSSPRQLTGRSSADDIPSSGGSVRNSSKRENQTSPPLLGSTSLHHLPSGLDPTHTALLNHHRFSPYNLSDFSSSQTLLNLVRTASAQSASQLENYLRGAATGKRPLETTEGRGDPLDLSSKRCRTDFDPIAAALHGVSDRLHPGGIAAATSLPFHLRDLVQQQAQAAGLKIDPSELLSGPIADLNAALRLSAKRGGSLSNLLDNRLLNNNNNHHSSSNNSKSSSHHELPAPTARTFTSATTGHHKSLIGRSGGSEKSTNAQANNCVSLCTEQSCTTKSDATEVSSWTVGDVVRFVNTIDCCSEYAEKFLEQSIDGASLCMLSEEHLTSFLGMKLGPALRLKAAIAKKIGHCATCMHCIHCHRDGEGSALHRTSSPTSSGGHSRHQGASPRPQSSSPSGQQNKETSRSSPVSK